MARMARMARLYDSHGSHGSLARMARCLAWLAGSQRNYSEPALNPECIDNGHYSAHLHAAQHELSTAFEEQFPYSVDQENPVVYAIHELGQRLVSNSEMMERRINERSSCCKCSGGSDWTGAGGDLGFAH